MNPSRRDLLKGAALAGAGLAFAGGAAGAESDKNLFSLTHPTIPIVGSEQRFPVRRIYCVGRNYAAHAREMGSDPNREPPFFFQKPSDAIQNVSPFNRVNHAYPPMTKNYHHEIELVAAIGKGGRNIEASEALEHVYGYMTGLDMTRRDLQHFMSDQKKPWELGKSFDHAAPIGPVFPVSQVGHMTKGAIWLKVNDKVRQKSDLANMTWSVAEQISNLSQYYELFPGDIIYCGTPENVGPVVKGDHLQGHIDGLSDLNLLIV